MVLIDTHCHLVSTKLSSNIDKLVEEANEAGVAKIINVAFDKESSHLSLKQSQISSSLYATVGIQPHDAATYSPDVAISLVEIAKREKRVVAIGEIGLDGFHKLSPMPAQITCYNHFLELAANAQLPTIVHMRETFTDVIAGIKKVYNLNPRGVIHCYTGTKDQAKAFLNLGFYLSFSGIITFKNNTELEDVVRYVPLDRLLVETDAPYLAPAPFRGQLNRPALVKVVCERVATLRNQRYEDVAQASTANALALFSRIDNA